MRICSLLPGATEIAFSLGLSDQIVGVTHECDYPHEARQKRIVVRSTIDPNRLTGGEIDRAVQELLESGKGLYTIDEQALIDSAPDVILTQGLCDVCALDYNAVVKATQLLARQPVIVSLNPRSFNDVLEDVLRIGSATHCEDAAQALVHDLRRRVDQLGLREPDYRPRVVCLEWFEPLYIAGHWVPEMVALAGGFDVLGRKGEPSFKIDWRSVVDSKPDVILLMPCGFDVRRAVKESTPLRRLEGWNDLPAVKADNVYALNGSAYFSRPGPRLVNGLEILAHIIHPNELTESLPESDAARFH
ncbi:MAG TPA: cobalamin-binding protein [Candidatus Binatia bacterium]|jgi:iron complex transport system substrate-binding protein|nr:cobalamin-binding protein [Candidatus Binatia bacterium]